MFATREPVPIQSETADDKQTSHPRPPFPHKSITKDDSTTGVAPVIMLALGQGDDGDRLREAKKFHSVTDFTSDGMEPSKASEDDTGAPPLVREAGEGEMTSKCQPIWRGAGVRLSFPSPILWMSNEVGNFLFAQNEPLSIISSLLLSTPTPVSVAYTTKHEVNGLYIAGDTVGKRWGSRLHGDRLERRRGHRRPRW